MEVCQLHNYYCNKTVKVGKKNISQHVIDAFYQNSFEIGLLVDLKKNVN